MPSNSAEFGHRQCRHDHVELLAGDACRCLEPALVAARFQRRDPDHARAQTHPVAHVCIQSLGDGSIAVLDGIVEVLEVQAWVATHEIAEPRDPDLATAPAGRDLIRWNPEQLLGIGLEEQVVQALSIAVEDQRFEAVLTLLRADDVVPHDPCRFEWHELEEHLDDVDGVPNPMASQANAAPAREFPHRHEGQHLAQ